MAGDYIPFDHDFPEKPEVLAIHEATGVSIGEIMLLLHRFWRLVDKQTEDGILRGVGIATLASQLGGSEDFWNAVQRVGWLQVLGGKGGEISVAMPGFKDRLSGRRGCARQRLKWAQKKQRQRAKRRGDMSAMSPGTTEGTSERTTAGQKGGQAPNQNQNHISLSPSSLRSEGERESHPHSPPDWLGTVIYPAGLDTPEVRQSLVDWFAWRERRGQTAIDPGMEASQLLRCFGTPAEVINSVAYAIGNHCLTLHNYAREHAGRQVGPQQRDRPARPTVDVGAIMRQKAAEKGEEYHG